MKRWLVVVGAVSLLSACADSHQLIRGDRSESKRLAAGDAIWIATPPDGAYGADVYRGSGQSTAQVIYAAFLKRTRSAKIGRAVLSFDEAREAARKDNHRYLVFPIILHWEDRATEWSMLPDKVEVKIEIVDVITGNAVASTVVKSKSGLATFGGDHPQDLLPRPVEEFVSSLY